MPPQFQSTGSPLAEVEFKPSTISLHEKIHPTHIKQSTSVVALHCWCYALHAILFVLQVVLLAMLWDHPERSITIAFDNSALTIGLSAFLQAFYTLYTALLVFFTQRLALTGFMSRPQKLTAIHDVSGAWSGLGAALTTLWRQTNLASSTGSILSIFVYLACVFVLHVASPIVMELEPYTAVETMDVPANLTWPGASVNLTALDTGTAGGLVTFMSSLPGLSTDGLMNSTLFDTFNVSSQMINASVNAHTMRASCGLLQNLSYTTQGELLIVNASMDGIGQASLTVNPLSLASNEVLFLQELQGGALTYMTSTPMKLNGSIGNNVSVDIVLDYAVTGSQYYNTSTTIYIVACSVEASSYTSILDIQSGNLDLTLDQLDPSSQAWSLFEYSSGTQLDLMVSSAYESTKCIGVCYGNGTLDDYLMTLLGLRQEPNDTSVTLTPYQVENALSRMTAQLIWIAGQLSEEDGGFAQTESLDRVTMQVPRWRLNINTIPVIFTLSGSLILLVTVFLILGVPRNIKKDTTSVKGTTVLEMLWTGAHYSTFRKRLIAISHPLPKNLRFAGMFDVCFTKSELAQESGSAEVLAFLNLKADTGMGFEDAMQGTRLLKRRPSMQRSWCGLQFIRSRRLWCYLLHGIFVLLHVVLLLLLMYHPEHHIVIQSVGEVPTTILAASLQFFYVAYTLMLVFITQRLAVSRAMARTQSLTSVHDLSQAWTGIGSALVGVWKQAKVVAALRTTLAITVYYLCVSVLHIASTTVIQFEVFEGNNNHTSQSTLAWPSSGLGTYDWGALSPIVPLDQLPSLSTKGLINYTVYDIPTVKSVSVNATVNATAIRTHCGLLPILSDDGGFVNMTVPTLGNVAINPFPGFWKDTVLFLHSPNLRNASNMSLTCSECDDYLMYLVTTALDIDTSDEAANTSMIWKYTPPGANVTYNETAYVVSCSLDATTRVDVLDVQNYILANTGSLQSDVVQQSWSVWSPVTSTPALSNMISSALNNAIQISSARDPSVLENAAFTNMDAYTMSLFGLNLTANGGVSMTQSSADGTATLTLSQFEDAISQIAAQYVWAAGHTNGDFGPVYGSGESIVTDLVVSRRLNANTIPVVIASATSFMLFILAVYMMGVGPSTPLSELGVLETLWLEAHSDVLHSRMRQVVNPTLDELRVSGMFQVCLADEMKEGFDGVCVAE